MFSSILMYKKQLPCQTDDMEPMDKLRLEGLRNLSRYAVKQEVIVLTVNTLHYAALPPLNRNFPLK